MRFLLPAVFGLSAAFAAPALADMTVTGNATDVTVKATGATLSELVDEISAKTGVRIDFEGSDDPEVDGDFHGSVETVLGDMMRNMSYMMTSLDSGEQGLLVVLYSGTSPPPSSAPTFDNSGVDDGSGQVDDGSGDLDNSTDDSTTPDDGSGDNNLDDDGTTDPQN